MRNSAAMKDTNINHKSDRTTRNAMGVSGTVIGDHRIAPEWIELLPAGDFAGRDGRGPFRLSNPSAVIAATNELRMEAGLPIDYDHATDFAAPAGRPAPAAGWIRTIEDREGALWGKVEWTSHGGAAVVTREYRYISPVFEYSQDGEVQRILRAALTNNPNLYLTAISARSARNEPLFNDEPQAQPTDENPDSERAVTTELDDLGTQSREVLGLEDEASSESVVKEVRDIYAQHGRKPEETFRHQDAGLQVTSYSAIADPAHYVPIEQFERTLTELNQLRASIARERAGFRVDAAMKAGKIVPSQREWAIAYCQANLSGFEKFIARQPSLVAGATTGFESEATFGRRAVNEERSEVNEGRRAGVSLTRTELSICARLGLRPHDYLRRRGAHGELPVLSQI